MKPLSYDAAWTDLTVMARANGSLLIVLAGVFLLLPGFAQAMWAPGPALKSLDLNGLKQLNDYFVEKWPVLLACQLPAWFGTAAIYALLLDRGRPTVGEALRAAGMLILPVIVLNWLTQFALLLGFLAFIVPGLYLIGRLAVAAPAQMAERMANPVAPLTRSFELTNRNGWRVTLFVIIVALVAGIAGSALTSVLGVVFETALPDALAKVLTALIRATIGAITALLMILLGTAIYRQLSSTRQAAAGS